MAWEIEISEEEMQRISMLLADKSHFAPDTFKNNIIKVRGFGEQAKQFHREVSGFKVGSKHYNKQVAQLILKQLKSSNPSSMYWYFYKATVAEYLSSTFPNFQTMNNDVSIEIVEGIETDSRFIIEQMCEHAAEYDVDEQAIKHAYELWPFERQNDFEQILTHIEQSKPLVPIRKKLTALSDKIDQTSKTLTDKFETEDSAQLKLEKNNDRIAQLEIEIDNKIDNAIGMIVDNEAFSGIRRHLIGLDTKTEQLSTKLQLLTEHTSKPIAKIGELDKRLQQLGAHINKPSAEIGKISTNLQQLKEQTEQSIENVEEKFTFLEKALAQSQEKIAGSTPSRETINQTVAVEQSKRNSPFQWFANKQPTPLSDDVDEATFIHHFADAFEQPDITTLKIYHQLFLTAPIIVLNQPNIITAWINALGWQNHTYSIAASPTWSDVNDWYDGGEFLFAQQDDKPKILFIYDFELGLVEAYLTPLLKIWRLSGKQQHHVKLVLVPSKPTECKYNPLPEPILWLPDKWLNVQLSAPTVNHHVKLRKTAITTAAFNRWCEASKTNTQAHQLLKKFPRFLTELRNAQITFSTDINHCCESLLLALLNLHIDEHLVQNIVIEGFILPWVAAHFGEGAVQEVVVRASRY